tara:strand:- start:73 stop:333 length:261 start_codon:yes stop_codon:yes gene_type:complete
MSFRLKGAEAACGTSVGAASTFEDSTDVRLFNSGSTNRVLTVADASDNTIGTMTLADGEVTFIRKDKTDQIFAAHAEILGTPVVWS